jgi:excisionase family DNA binding protein
MTEPNGRVQLAAATVESTPRLSPARLLTAEQLADRWQVSPAHVYRLTREGAVPVVRLGRYYRYRAAAIELFEEAGGCDSEAGSE